MNFQDIARAIRSESLYMGAFSVLDPREMLKCKAMYSFLIIFLDF